MQSCCFTLSYCCSTVASHYPTNALLLLHATLLLQHCFFTKTYCCTTAAPLYLSAALLLLHVTLLMHYCCSTLSYYCNTASHYLNADVLLLYTTLLPHYCFLHTTLLQHYCLSTLPYITTASSSPAALQVAKVELQHRRPGCFIVYSTALRFRSESLAATGALQHWRVSKFHPSLNNYDRFMKGKQHT